MKKSNLLFVSIPVLALLVGCGTQLGSSSSSQASSQPNVMALKANQTQLKNGDIQETTDSLDQLPSFLDGADPKVVNAYKVAAKNIDLLKNIPCYCGCGQEAGHKSNADCFIMGKTADGKIIWDDHGTRCSTCMDIATTSAQMKQAGQTVWEIRKFIDQKYSQGYAQPTPTPMPQSN